MLYASEVAVAHRNLATVDLIIIGVYFAIVFGIGMYFARKERTSEDYFLAGRDIGWFFIGASLFVSNISTEHFIGLSGTGASSGLAVGHFEWLACLILLILGWVFVPFYLRSNVFTMPEFLERRFNRQCAVYLAAVIYTDTVQTLILITGAVALTIIGLGRVGGLEHLRTMVPPDYFHMMKPSSDPNFPWTGIFFGAPILGIWYWCTDQVIVQRVLSARDEGHAKAGTIFAGFLKILPVFMLVLPGIIAFALFPDQVKKPDFAYPTLVLNLLPVGLVGLVMAALLAAVMGAMSSVFNSASTLVTLDFYKKIRPQASERQLVAFGRIATGGMVLLGLLWVPFIHLLSAELYIYLQSVQAYISPPIAVCFIFGILWPRLNGQGAISSLLAGFVLGAVRFIFEVLDKTRHYDSGAIRWLVDMNFLHYAILMFVICAAVLIGVSMMYPAPERKKIAGLTFATVGDKLDSTDASMPHLQRETPTERLFNLGFTGVLIATVVGLWIYFR